MKGLFMSITRIRVALAIVATIAVVQSGVAASAEIKVLSSNGIREVMKELIPQFEKSTQNKVLITYGLSAALKRQIDAGETFDIAILTPQLIDDEIKQGKIGGDTRTVLARAGMALAVGAGKPKPDIRTTEALKTTLLAAHSIAYAREGASGVFLNGLMPRLGLVESLKPKLRPTTTGEEVAAAVSRGEADLGILPLSEFLPVPGVDVVGTFPAEVQGYAVMVGGVSSTSRQKAAANDLLKFVTASAALPVLKKKGMEKVPDSALSSR
jgi:molybdate transport system substrate-binding protein